MTYNYVVQVFNIVCRRHFYHWFSGRTAWFSSRLHINLYARAEAVALCDESEPFKSRCGEILRSSV